MNIVRYPTTSGAWADNVFGQYTVFSFGEKDLSLAVLFEAPDLESFHLRGLEKAWESATAAAFIHRSLSSEELIEKILTAINTTVKESSISLQGAVLLTEGLRVHFSTIGETDVLLYDGKTITCVSSVQKGQDFTAVTSGEVDQQDIVLLTPSFISDEIQNKSKLTPELLEELCANEKIIILSSTSEQVIITSQQTEEPGENRVAVAGKSIASAAATILSTISSTVKKIHLPKIRVRFPSKIPKLKFKISSLSRPVTILALIIFVGGIYFAGTVIAERIKIAKQVEAPPKTLLSRLKDVSDTETVNFLSTEFEFAQYQTLNDQEKSEFAQELQRRSIEPINTVVKQALPEKILDISMIGSISFVLDASGQLWRYDTTLRKIEQSGLIVEPQRVLAIKENRILVTDKAGNIWLYDGSATQPISLPLPQSLASGLKLVAKYNNNIYIYSSETKAISRISGFDRDVINPSSYANSETLGLGLLRDLFITGDGIALDNSGKIKIFSRNSSLKEATATTTETSRLIPVATNWIQLTGRLITTYSPDLSPIKTGFLLIQDAPASAVAQNDQLFIVGAGNTLYGISN